MPAALRAAIRRLPTAGSTVSIPATLRAFADHGRVVPDAVETDPDQAELVMQQLEKTGINFNCVTWQLEHEGVQKFVDAYDAAMAALEKKRSRLHAEQTA